MVLLWNTEYPLNLILLVDDGSGGIVNVRNVPRLILDVLISLTNKFLYPFAT